MEEKLVDIHEKEKKAITSMMAEERVFNPLPELSEKAYIKSLDEYREIYRGLLTTTRGSGRRRRSNWTGLKSGIRCLSRTSRKVSMSGSWEVS